MFEPIDIRGLFHRILTRKGKQQHCLCRLGTLPKRIRNDKVSVEATFQISGHIIEGNRLTLFMSVPYSIHTVLHCCDTSETFMNHVFHWLQAVLHRK